MKRRMRIRPIILISMMLGAHVMPASAQPGGSELMRSGNELFRAGAYALAVARYQEAIEAGYAPPLLYYNQGIASYQLGNYLRAELAFERALADPALEALATYNLGLARLASEQPQLAAQQFERVLQLDANDDLHELARRALASSEQDLDRRSQVTSTSERRPYREPDPPLGDLRILVTASYGSDSNVYRTPSAAYVDLAQTGQPLINPNPQSASYTPVNALVRYVFDSAGQKTRYNASYRLNGDFYDSVYSNANEITQRFEIGADARLEGRHERSLETAFFGLIHDETNFDPDTGLDRDVGGQDISSRFSYKGAGLESRYDHELQYWSWGFDARMERRSYDDTPVVPRYDHEFYLFSLRTQLQLNELMSVGLQLRTYRREYDVRRARDIDGVLSNANPALEYIYETMRLQFERRLAAPLNLTASWLTADRSDNFNGYADYTQSALSVGLAYRPNSRLRLDLDLIGRTYDYPKAFAFNTPAGGPMDVDSTDIEFSLEYRFNPGLSMWIETELFDESSSDPRITYDRTRAAVGIRWRR